MVGTMVNVTCSTLITLGVGNNTKQLIIHRGAQARLLHSPLWHTAVETLSVLDGSVGDSINQGSSPFHTVHLTTPSQAGDRKDRYLSEKTGPWNTGQG